MVVIRERERSAGRCLARVLGEVPSRVAQSLREMGSKGSGLEEREEMRSELEKEEGLPGLGPERFISSGSRSERSSIRGKFQETEKGSTGGSSRWTTSTRKAWGSVWARRTIAASTSPPLAEEPRMASKGSFSD